MRCDVVLSDESVEDELAQHRRRLRETGRLDTSSWRPTPVCDVSMLRHDAIDRSVVYLKDARTSNLVGHFTFETVPARRARLPWPVTMPHSKLLPAHRGLGLAKWIYREELRRGRCLLSSARQSPAAASVWQSLAKTCALSYVWFDGRLFRHLGDAVTPGERRRLEVRMLLSPQTAELARVDGRCR